MTQTAVTEESDAFFEIAYSDDEIPDYIPRDQWKRPRIIPPDGGPLESYTRVSTMAGTLDEKSGLHKWAIRQVARGVGLDEDLAAQAACLPAETGNKRLDQPTNAALDEIAEQAMRVAGAHKEREWGTAVHGFTEKGMEGVQVPKRMQADVRSYWDMLRDLRLFVVATEIFVVNDELKIAGTFDDLYLAPYYGIVLGDKKTGRRNIHATMMQLSGYSRGHLYNPETGERYPLTNLLTPEMWEIAAMLGAGKQINQSQALYISIPKEKGRTEIYDLDIHLGYEAARRAMWAREYNKRKDVVKRAEAGIQNGLEKIRAEAAQFLDDVTTGEEARGVFERYMHVWTDELSEHGRKVLASRAAA